MIKSYIRSNCCNVHVRWCAFAGPYVNVETNAGWVGDDYTAAVTDLHVGYEGPIGESAGWYVQGGPALVNVDGEEA